MIVVETLQQTLSALQAFGQKLGFAVPGDRKGDAGVDETGELPELEAGEPVSPLDLPLPLPQRSYADSAAPDTTVYGFRANLKPVKAPDEVRGHFLNTLV
jgi:hypothetical protein